MGPELRPLSEESPLCTGPHAGHPGTSQEPAAMWLHSFTPLLMERIICAGHSIGPEPPDRVRVALALGQQGSRGHEETWALA